MSKAITETDVIRYLATDIAEKISLKVINETRKLKDILSGEDSGLENVWDEICVQAQGEHSIFYDAYDDIIRSISLPHIKVLNKHEKLALWFQTNEGIHWLNVSEDAPNEEQDFGDEEFLDYIVNLNIYAIANDYTNKRIRNYLGIELN